ncbi:MAG: hypothetical protein Q8P46_00205 [Hyphomicrobiales bacterium]|nr:hypothetical protein [Hyphomicrobiales bacterium]
MESGAIIGFDVGRLLGFAAGMPGTMPESSTVALSKPGGALSLQAANLIAFLDKTFREYRPALVAKEAPFSLAAFSDHHVNEAAVRSAFGLHCIIDGMCQRFGIPCHESAVATVTKHFTGKARHGGRTPRKRAIMQRCRVLGYVPADCRDEDRCDALCVWDWAAATLARVPPKELVLFNEGAAA